MRPDMNKVNEITSRYILPTIEERTSYGYKRLDPYTKLFEERIIFLGQAIDDTVANDVMAQLLTLESMDPDRDIMMYINSPGGSFTALTAIYDTMQFVEMLAHHSKKSQADIAKDIERDKILTSAEAVEYGLIDQVLATRKAKAKS